jgi:hypothetical protein
MNWRAIGCAVFAAAVFVGLGIWSLQMALGKPGCPPALQWGDRVYVAAGRATAEPVAGDGEPVLLGTTLVGPLSRDVYGPPGSAPSHLAGDRPETIALECGDGTFVTYTFSDVLPTAGPTAGSP